MERAIGVAAFNDAEGGWLGGSFKAFERIGRRLAPSKAFGEFHGHDDVLQVEEDKIPDN